MFYLCDWVSDYSVYALVQLLTSSNVLLSQMSWRPTYRSSKFRNVYGKVANREHCFDGIPITKNVHDNHFCAVNSKFLAIVTESSGGGSFIVVPVSQVTGVYSKHIRKILLVCWSSKGPARRALLAHEPDVKLKKMYFKCEGKYRMQYNSTLLKVH